jgi:addiction module HigA family antidote
MPKNTKTPGSALNALLKKYNLNYNRLAKAIGLSSAMVRLIARDENPVSAAVAFRLAKFFKMKPDFWLSLQADYDLAKTVADKKLAKELKDIPTVDKATFERKQKAKKAAKPAGKKGRSVKAKATPKKTTAKSKAAKTAKPAAKKAAPKKTAKAPAKKPAKAPQKAAPAQATKPAAVKPAQAPVVKPVSAPVKPAAPAQPVPSSQPAPASQPVPSPTHSEPPINEPKF